MSEHLDVVMPDLPDGWAWQPGEGPDGEHTHQLFHSEPNGKPQLVATMALRGTGQNVRYMRVDERDGVVWTHPSLMDAAKWAIIASGRGAEL